MSKRRKGGKRKRKLRGCESYPVRKHKRKPPKKKGPLVSVKRHVRTWRCPF